MSPAASLSAERCERAERGTSSTEVARWSSAAWHCATESPVAPRTKDGRGEHDARSRRRKGAERSASLAKRGVGTDPQTSTQPAARLARAPPPVGVRESTTKTEVDRRRSTEYWQQQAPLVGLPRPAPACRPRVALVTAHLDSLGSETVLIAPLMLSVGDSEADLDQILIPRIYWNQGSRLSDRHHVFEHNSGFSFPGPRPPLMSMTWTQQANF